MNHEIFTSAMPTNDPSHDPSVEASGFNNRMADPSPVPTEQPGPEVKDVPLKAIEIDEGFQARVQLDPDTVDAYAEEMRHGAILPAIDVYEKDTRGDIHYLLVDGWHRLEAAKRIDATSILARVHQGNRRDALIHAAGANSKNGLRRTNADKRRAVEMLLHDKELVKRSDNELARIAVVDRITVRNIRNQLEASCEIHMIEAAEVTRAGKTYPQHRKHKTLTSDPKLELQNNDGSPTPLPQVKDEEDIHDENPQLRLAASPARHPRPKQDHDQSIEVTHLDDEGGFTENHETAIHNENVDPQPEKSDHEAQPALQDAPSDALPEFRASQAPVPALQSLLERFEGDVCAFRAQHACDDSIVKEVLDSLESELQRDQHRLSAHARCLVHADSDFDIEDTVTPGPEETKAHDDPDAQGTPLSSEASSTTAEPLDPAAAVQDFVKRRCTSSPDSVSHNDVMVSINTWLDNQKRPRLNDTEVIRELHRLGFHDFNDMVSEKVETNAGWQWQGLQLLPFDAPDTEVDPFSLPSA